MLRRYLLIPPAFSQKHAGVFKQVVEWCIIVTTPEEAILCALARDHSPNYDATTDEDNDTANNNGGGFRHGNDSVLRLIPTRFILPTDSVPLMSICGSKDGRIFMGGYDGCLYEMNYEGSSDSGRGGGSRSSESEMMEAAIDNYFDGEGVFRLSSSMGGEDWKKWSEQAMISGGKRVLSALTFGSLEDYSSSLEQHHQRSRKCRKINHSSVAPGLVSSVVPGAMIRVALGIFGSSTEAAARKGGPIVSLVLDEERHCLYTLGANGVVCAYDVSPMVGSGVSGSSGSGAAGTAPGNHVNSSPRLACVFDAVASAKLYLDSVSRGRMYPPSTSQSIDLGTITFPGGIASAQAGVGGMEGAREILKRHDQETRMAKAGSSSSSSRMSRHDITNVAGILHPVSIHLVPGVESKSLTLVAVTGGGLRYYLSSLSSSYINSAQVSQGGFDYSGRGSDFILARTRPSKKMTFCHIRAPPPYTSGDGNDDFRFELAPSAVNMMGSGASCGGIPPGIHSSQGMKSGSAGGDVVKSFYGKGMFVLALDLEKGSIQNNKNKSSGGFFAKDSEGKKSSSTSTVGDVIVVTLPDSAARVESSTSNSTNGTTSTALTVYTESQTSSRSVPGGVSETAILPATGVGGTSSPALSGGRTFDIVSHSNKQPSVVNLFMNSETPTDVELQAGLMPSYTPPKSQPRRSNQSSGTSSALVVASDRGRGVVSAALSALSNYLRSGQGSGYQVGTVSTDPNGFGPSVMYRVSFRYGCETIGFSNSAAEVSTMSRSGVRNSSISSVGTAKSARLPTWMLRPTAAPLNFQASQHLLPPGSGSVLVLNAGGLHFFSDSSLLNNLASVLLRANNVAKDDLVRNFFTSYGYVEGCAMCFALATSRSSSASLRSKAEMAALTHAHKPSMTVVGSGDGRDPLSAYKFMPSSLYDGLVKFSSRLLRPFWYKPAVIVTESRPIQSKSAYSNYYASLPAKVELLLDDYTLDDIRRPLVHLQALMKKTFVPAVQSVPGVANKNSTDAMEVDEDGGQITRALQNQARAAQRINNSDQNQDVTPDELRAIARRTEERNMHSLYRLLSRCVQALNLMACLKYAHLTPALPEVQWGLLHGLTFYQLVTSQEGQQRVETLLNSLVSQGDNNLVSGLSTEGDLLADTLSRQCYLFFSSASRLTYLGFKSAKDALSRPPQRVMLANQAASYLRAASRHWYDPALVAGRWSSKNTSESCEEIAVSAKDAGSPLALAAGVLMDLGNAEGLADVCLICASNFGGSTVPRDERKETGEIPVEGMFDWEKGLYHQPPSDQSGDRSSSQAIVTGIDVTPADALRTCHGILFYYVTKLLSEGGVANQRFAEDLVAACASSSDVKFLHSLYKHLLATNEVDTLLRIDSSTLENWLLKEKKDINLIWRYYSFHGRNVLAGDTMFQRAVDLNEKISLDQRIECLTRAANSFSAALQSNNPGTNMMRLVGGYGQSKNLQEPQLSVDDLKTRITQIKEQLDVATLQRRVLTTVEQSENLNLESAKKEALSFTLVNVSDIYNDYASPLNLFDVCLLILETCQHNQPDTINTLWKSILCEELLPCETNSESVLDFLRSLKAGSVLENETIAYGDGNNGGNLQQFENGEWIPRLRNRITELGKEIYGKGADYTFPVDLILNELEGKL